MSTAIIVLLLVLGAAALLGLTRLYNQKFATRRTAASEAPMAVTVQALEPVQELPAAKRVMVGDRLYRRVLSRIPEEEVPIRVTRLHWGRALLALPLIYMMLLLANAALFHPNFDKDFAWPTFSSDSTSKSNNPVNKAVDQFVKAEKKAIEKSSQPKAKTKKLTAAQRRKLARKRKAAARARAKAKAKAKAKAQAKKKSAAAKSKAASKSDKFHLHLPLRMLYLALLLTFLLVMLRWANIFSWIWTVWVVTDQNIRKLVLPPQFVPMGITKDPLSMGEIKGVRIHISPLGRIFSIGTLTLRTKVENTDEEGEPMDPIHGMPDPEGCAADVTTAYKAYQAQFAGTTP